MFRTYLFVIIGAFFLKALSYAQETEPMDAFDFLEGDWQVTQSLYGENGWDKSGEAQNAHFTDSMNGKLTSGTVLFKTDDFAMSVLVSISYDNVRRINRVSLMDDVVGLMDIYEGRIYESGLAATNIGPGTWFPDGNSGKRHFKLRIENTGTNSALIAVDTTTDNGMTWAPYINWDLVRP